ncbi:hypothetical protein JCM8202_004705 [Rhodotorula sphaerocarpa]
MAALEKPASPSEAAPLSPAALPDSNRSRRRILTALWAVVVLGVPLWWHTTALERRTLPEERIQQWSDDYQERIPALLHGAPTDQANNDGRVVKFSPQYKLAFTLLNEDSTLGSAILDWDAPTLVRSSIGPLLESLAPLHNFTIETQVQYFAPLAVELHHKDDEAGAYVDEADLKAFVNNAEWNLATGETADPVLQFSLFVPSVQNRPLRIRRQDGRIAPPAFIAPQRGGVVIYNPPAPAHEQPPSVALDAPTWDLLPSFLTFEEQFRALLGLEPGSHARRGLSREELDALARRRLREATEDTVETLLATVRLAREIQNMQINGDVQGRIYRALDRLDEAVSSSSALEALHHVAAAQALASRAYFDPSMMALLYFPDEHKYAVYTPLFGPVAVPLVLALVKEVKEWRAERKRRKAREEEGRAPDERAEVAGGSAKEKKDG